VAERGFLDRDFLSTNERFLFCVVGPYHPQNRVISYIKYLPDAEGKWQKGNERFKRVLHTYSIPSLLDTFDLLKASHPQYLFYSPIYNITMTAVPRKNIVQHFMPEKKLAELFGRSRLDPLQARITRFISSLSEFAGIPVTDFGVTGSVLLDIHNPAFSDMDITVYGVESSYATKDALSHMFTTASAGVKQFEGEKLRQWYASKTQTHPISLVEARAIYRRKWNIGLFEGTLFSVHPTKVEREIPEAYGDRIFHPVSSVALQAVVSDATDSIFLPAVYKVREVQMDKPRKAEIREVVSYEGLYDSLADEDEMIEVHGKLERVVDSRRDEEYYRVLVGSPEGRGREFIKRVA
jgi:predicted nucleotidyltransferase